MRKQINCEPGTPQDAKQPAPVSFSLGLRQMKSAIIGSVIWIVLCIVGGFVALARLGDYGSIVQPLIGFVIGLLGALSHALLCMTNRFRALRFPRRALLNWLCAYIPFTGLVIFFTNFGMIQYNPDFWPKTLRFMLFHTGGPMLLAAFLVAMLTPSARRKDDIQSVIDVTDARNDR
jgi:hypothetical protein